MGYGDGAAGGCSDGGKVEAGDKKLTCAQIIQTLKDIPFGPERLKKAHELLRVGESILMACTCFYMEGGSGWDDIIFSDCEEGGWTWQELDAHTYSEHHFLQVDFDGDGRVDANELSDYQAFTDF